MTFCLPFEVSPRLYCSQKVSVSLLGDASSAVYLNMTSQTQISDLHEHCESKTLCPQPYILVKHYPILIIFGSNIPDIFGLKRHPISTNCRFYIIMGTMWPIFSKSLITSDAVSKMRLSWGHLHGSQLRGEWSVYSQVLLCPQMRASLSPVTDSQATRSFSSISFTVIHQ